jgi:hypothetical protein
MQMTSTNGLPLMKTSGNYHLEYQHQIHVQLVTTIMDVNVATPLWPSVRMKLTLPKLGTWSPSGLPNL